MERTQLMHEAVIHEAARLGVRWTVEPIAPLAASWPYMPDRGDDEPMHVSSVAARPTQPERGPSRGS